MLSLITLWIFMVMESFSNKKNLSTLCMSTFFPLSYMTCFSSAVCIGSTVQWPHMSCTVNTGLQVEHTTEEELDEKPLSLAKIMLSEHWIKTKRGEAGWKLAFDKKCAYYIQTIPIPIVNLLGRSLTGLLPAPKGSKRQASDTQWMECVLLMSYYLQ